MSIAVVPQGWDDRPLLDLVTIKSGQVDPRDPKFRNLPLIAPDHLVPQTGRLIKKESAAAQGAISGKYLVRPGDVIYSKIRPYLQKAFKCDFHAMCSADMYPLTPRPGVDSSFVFHSLLSREFTNFAVSVSARSGIPKINREEFAEYRLPVPCGAEQRAIGRVLDEVDSLIATLERLIAKKQAIKQGMMQQLLTGRTRLPGFNDEWAHATLGSLSRVTGGGTPSTRVSSFWGGGIPWFTPAEIQSTGAGLVSRSERTITPDGLARSSANLLPAGTVLVTSRASIGNCAVAASPVTTNQGFASMIPKDPRSTWFLYYWIQQNKSAFESRAVGSTFLEISASKVSSIPLNQPKLDEQGAISATIRDTDLELDALARKLTKARAIKTGMMQELLTGRTRLRIETGE